MLSRPAFRPRHSRQRWRFSTGTGRNGCRRTSCRRNATSSARTPTSAWTSRGASSSTPTGRDAAVESRQPPTTFDLAPIKNKKAGRNGSPFSCAFGELGLAGKLLQALPRVIGEDTDDANGHGRGGEAEDANNRLNLVDFTNDLVLFALFVAFGVAQE